MKTEGVPPLDQLTDSSSLRGDGKALLERMDQDGYVFLRDTIPQEQATAASRELQACLEDLGLAARGYDHPHWSGLSEDSVPAEDIFDQVHSRVPLADLWRNPTMAEVMESLLGEAPYVFQYSDVRTYLPKQDHYLSPAHQDGFYIGPNLDYFTAWTPLTNIPRPLGGLAIAEGSHHTGVRTHVKRQDRRSHLPGHAQRYGIEESDIPERWVTADYRLGDVLIFHPFTVHKAPSNTTDDRIRVSTDTRFQPQSTERAGLSLMTAWDVRDHERSSSAKAAAETETAAAQ
jgi:1-deoxypentalenic acid 11beta-hydroxylase